MKNQQKLIVSCICIAVVLLLTAGSVLLWYLFGRAEYRQIYRCDFNDPESRFGLLETDAYRATGTEFTYEPDAGMDGSGCVAIRSSEENDARFTFRCKEARTNTYYRVSVWIRTEDVENKLGSDGHPLVGANLSVLNVSGRSQDYTGSTDWTYIEYYGKTARNQKEFTVALRLGFYSAMNTGTVYFDDFEVEQLSALPDGAYADSWEPTIGVTDQVQPNAQHHDTMLAAVIIVLYTVVFIAIIYRYARKRDLEAQQIDLLSGSAVVNGLSVRGSVLILIAIGFALRVVLSFTMPQCDIDVNLFQYWGNNLAEQGIPDFYAYAKANNLNLDYPPLFLYYLYFLGLIGKIGGIAQSAAFDVLLKLPSMLADCVIAYILYKLASKRMSKNWTLFVLSVWLFNPMVLLDSACWGQVDSLLTLALLLSAYFIEKDRYAAASAALAYAVTLKPQGIFFIPILGFALLRQLIREKELPLAKRLLRFAYSITAFFVTALLIVLPFGIKAEPNLFSWIIDVYLNTAGGYSYATVNSFNFFYLIGANWVKDSTRFLGVSYFAWGMLAIVVLSLLTGALYLFGKKKRSSVYLLSAMLIYAVTTFGPRMHERYFYPALALLLVTVIYTNHKVLLAIFSVMSISNFFTVLEVMTGLSIGGALIQTDYATASYYYWPPLNTERTIMTCFNILCAVALIGAACVISLQEQTESRGMLRIWEETKEMSGDSNEA